MKIHELKDEEIVKNIEEGGKNEEKAIGYVMDNFESIKQYIRGMISNTGDVDDLYIDSILIFRDAVKSGKFMLNPSIHAYLKQIILNKAINQYKRKQLFNKFFKAEKNKTTEDTTVNINLKELIDVLGEVIGTQCKKLLTDYWVKGKNLEEMFVENENYGSKQAVSNAISDCKKELVAFIRKHIDRFF